MECNACARSLAPEDSACPACGTPTRPLFDDSDTHEGEAAGGGTADEEPWRNQPTTMMPAVMLPDGQPDEPAAASQQVTLAPPLDAEFVSAAPERRGSPRESGAAFVGALVGAGGVLALGLLLAVGVLAFGGLDALRSNGPPGGGLTTSEPTAATDEQPDEEDEPAPTEPATAADGSYSCEPQQLTAPGSGRWTLYRAQFGTRERFDYLTLLLRRGGQDDGTASVRAELMAPAEVADRYGLEAPSSADAALVLAFDGPVRIAGNFGSRPGHRALNEFRIAQDSDGTVHAVVGIGGDGCFALSGGDWQAGQSSNRTEITLRIER